MKILLLGDYSNVHVTLAKGLRALNHEVVVASDGDGWKGYSRDVDLRRTSYGAFGSMVYYAKMWKTFLAFKGFDVVQLINPVFLSLKAERIWPFYRFLRQHNKLIFLGAFGIDHYWVKTARDCQTFRYRDFNIGPQYRHREDNATWQKDWGAGTKGLLNQHIAQDCDGIVAGLYEYYASYVNDFAHKLRFIPFPIDADQAPLIPDFGKDNYLEHRKLRIFIGIQKHRDSYKGTDIMWRALQRVAQQHPDRVEVVRVENVPFAKYMELLRSSDVLLDQLYSYTPAMNALQALAQGLIVVGGGEPENYEILRCDDLRPIVNVQPTEQSVVDALTHLVTHPDLSPRLSQQSRLYVERYHNHLDVAQQYLDFWQAQ